MKSQSLGKRISEVEVTNVDRHGLWVFVRSTEYFLPFSEFPWFREAKITHVLNVELLQEKYLHWPDLDVDLSLSSIKKPSDYPLTWRN